MNLKQIGVTFAKKVAKKSGYEIRRPANAHELDYSRFYSEESIRGRRFYNIGAGGFSHPIWTNVDHMSDWYRERLKDNVGIDWDLLSISPLPVEDAVAEAVYTSHTVEHVTDEAVANMFSEAYRILKPGGYFRVTTPNIDLDYRAYCDGDREYFYWMDNAGYCHPDRYPSIQLNRPGNEASVAQRFVWHLASNASTFHADTEAEQVDDETLAKFFAEMEYEKALDAVKSRASMKTQRKYPGNHINWWNESKLRRMLEAAGFTNIYLSGFGQSHCPAMRDVRLFDNTHPPISIYVEARK